MTRLKLVLLYGGQSGEHEVSLQSAASVLAALDASRYDVISIGMDKQGCLYVNNTEILRHQYANKALPVALPDAERLPSLLLNGKLAVDAELVFPVMHGPLCEDGALQGLLNLAGVAYVGCDVLSSAVSMDKDIARQLVGELESIHAVPYYRLPYTKMLEHDRRRCEEAVVELGWPVFVKPCSLGSSVGIHRADTMEQLLTAVRDARRYDTAVLIEAFIAGREIEVGVLEHDSCEGLPDVTVPGEIQVGHADGFYSYAAKYIESDDNKLCIPAALNEEATRHVQMAAAEIFMRLRCHGLARVDFFVQAETNKIYFNEINTLPGFTSMSMFPKLWEASGLSYSALLDRLIALAHRRQRSRDQLVTDYSSTPHHALA